MLIIFLIYTCILEPVIDCETTCRRYKPFLTVILSVYNYTETYINIQRHI